MFSEPLTLRASAIAVAPASPMLMPPIKLPKLRMFSEALNFYQGITLLY